jgi:hypothetical protein
MLMAGVRSTMNKCSPSSRGGRMGISSSLLSSSSSKSKSVYRELIWDRQLNGHPLNSTVPSRQSIEGLWVLSQ